MYQATMLASLQYPGVGGPVAHAWMAEWLAAHASVIKEHPNNGHSLFMLNPPHVEGCVSQMDMEYHFETNNQQEYSDLFDEVKNAIYFGSSSPFCEAGCDSSFQ